jgi:cell division protein FtsL
MPTIVLRFLGGFLIYLSLIVIINIRKIQNDTEIKKIDEKMSEFEKRKAEFDKQISEFENQQL